MALGRIKRLKQPPTFRRADARATVLYQYLDGSRLVKMSRDGHEPLQHWGRAHSVHRVHDEVYQHLLQLNGIAQQVGQTLRRLDLDAVPATDQLAIEEGQCRMHQVIDVDAFRLLFSPSQELT